MANKGELLFKRSDCVVTNPFTGNYNAHDGVDYGFNGDPKVSCYAVSDGVVNWSANTNAGELVMIYFESEDYTGYYLHLSQRNVVAGQRVVKGQQIGITGDTGAPDYAKGVHLHFGWAPGNKPTYNMTWPSDFVNFETYTMKNNNTNGGKTMIQIFNSVLTLIELTAPRGAYVLNNDTSYKLGDLSIGTKLVCPAAFNGGPVSGRELLWAYCSPKDNPNSRFWVALIEGNTASSAKNYKVIQENYVFPEKTDCSVELGKIATLTNQLAYYNGFVEETMTVLRKK